MRNNSLSKKGLTMSDAQSISNMINQRANNINAVIDSINVAQKSVVIDGIIYVTEQGVKVPSNIVELIKSKATLHACQAFLMENIKAKETLLTKVKTVKADLSAITVPEEVYRLYPKIISDVKEEWGWEQLTSSELEEYYTAEAFASHVGQFIHKGQKLDKLRKENMSCPSVEWLEVETGKKIPVKITLNDTSTHLNELHEELAILHKTYENKVNYFKAKVKNLVTIENSRIAKINADEINKVNTLNNIANTEYNTQYSKYQMECQQATADFEKQRGEKIKEIVDLRINIPTYFQAIIDMFQVTKG